MIIKVQKKNAKHHIYYSSAPTVTYATYFEHFASVLATKGVVISLKIRQKRRIYIKIDKEEKEENKRNIFLVQLAAYSYFS